MDQTAHCPVCGSALPSTAVEKSSTSSLYHCVTCDLQVWEPRRNPGPHWYDENAHYLAKAIVNWLGWYQRYGLSEVPADAQRLLDVGCADGRFVYAAAARGIDAVGIDFSERLVRDGNTRHQGHRLVAATLEDYLEQHSESFDVVTLFEVIEHVEDPLSFLGCALSAVREGGTVIVSTPNRDGFPHPPKGYDEPPHHLTRWSLRALGELAKRAGIVGSRIAVCPPEVGIKAFLLGIRFGIVVRLLRRRAAAKEPGHASHDDVRALIRAKDLAAGGAARLLTPIVGQWFPGPSMVLVGKRGGRAERLA